MLINLENIAWIDVIEKREEKILLKKEKGFFSSKVEESYETIRIPYTLIFNFTSGKTKRITFTKEKDDNLNRKNMMNLVSVYNKRLTTIKENNY